MFLRLLLSAQSGIDSNQEIEEMSASAIIRPLWLTTLCLAMLGSGCSVKRLAINRVGDALTGSGTTFASDDDPELVKAAVPFSLKLMESLLAESPRH